MSGYQRFAKRHPRWHKAIQVGKTVAQVAGQAMSIASTIAGVINAEHKHVDTIANAAQSNATPTITCLTNIAQGNNDTERSGNSVLMKHIYIKGAISRTSANAWVRFILLRDMNDNGGTAPTISDILQNYSTAYCWCSAHQKTKTDRFKILVDKSISLDTYHPYTKIKIFKEFRVKQYKNANGKVKIKGEHCTYSGSNSSNTSRGHLYLVTISSVDADTPYVTWYARFGYVDN